MRKTLTGLSALCLVLMMALPASAGVGPVYAPGSSPLGTTYQAWEGSYWTWLQEIPRGRNPALHPQAPTNCAPVSGAVFLGPFGSNCDVPAGVPVVFATVAWECSTAEGLGDSFFQLRRCATRNFSRDFGERSFHQRVLIDGERLGANRRWTFLTPGEIVDFPDRNIWHADPGPSRSVTKGFLFILRALSPGIHRIRVRAHFIGVGGFTVGWKLHVA